jgi:Ca2+-transporting ATPase
MLLWINLVTDGFPAVALGADPKVPGILKRKPRQQDEPVIDFRILSSIALIGVLMTVAGLGLFFYSLTAQGDLIRAQSSLFTFMVLVEMVIIQVIRSRYRQSLLSNYWLIFAVLLTLLLQLAVIYTPLHTFFQVSQILPSEWLWIAIAFAIFLLSSLGIQPLEKKLESWRV